MGKVDFGATEETINGKTVHRPFISLTSNHHQLVLFTANLTFDSLDMAREFIMNTYQIISKPKPDNLKYDRNGNA